MVCGIQPIPNATLSRNHAYITPSQHVPGLKIQNLPPEQFALYDILMSKSHVLHVLHVTCVNLQFVKVKTKMMHPTFTN